MSKLSYKFIIKETFLNFKKFFLPLIIINIIAYISFLLLYNFIVFKAYILSIFTTFNVYFIIANIAYIYINSWTKISAYTYVFKKLNNQEIGIIKTLKIDYFKTLKLFIATVIVYIFIIIGLVLFIFPGLYLSLRFILVPPLITLENYSIVKGIIYSWKLTKNNASPILAVFLIIFIPIIISLFSITNLQVNHTTETKEMIFIAIGLFCTIPNYFISTTLMYKFFVDNYQLNKT